MHQLHRCTLIAILALAAGACGPYPGGPQIAQAPAIEQDTVSTVEPEVPAPYDAVDSGASSVEQSSGSAVEGSAGSAVEQSAGSAVEGSDGSAVVSSQPSEACPITLPPDPAFTPPATHPQAAGGNYFWYGSNALWTAVPGDGIWAGLPDNPEGYTQKVFWWNETYIWTEEPEPALVVTGQRLDAPADPLNVSRATNAYADDIGSAMLVGVDFPTLGCWEITGRYKGAELSFVVWIAP